MFYYFIIISGGSLVIGQDQDIVGGGFQLKDAFAGGNITRINIWDTVYPDIRAVSGCSQHASGNLVSWRQRNMVLELHKISMIHDVSLC